MTTARIDRRLPAPGQGNPDSNLDQVLHRIGRASTPEVPTSPFGITLGQLLALPTRVDHGAVVIGAQRTIEAVQAVVPTLIGLPGALRDQVSVEGVDALVIEWSAFSGGPWLGANSHAAHALSEEIFDAGRILRSAGALVYGLPPALVESSTDARLLSTCTVNLREVPDVDLEENATQSPLWEALIGLLPAHERVALKTAVDLEGAEA